MTAPDHTPDSDLKRCSKCKELKPRSEFHKARKEKDGLRSRCKCCVAIDGAERYANNPEYHRDYYYAHHEEHLEYRRQWRSTHQEYIKRYRRQYYIIHQEELREVSREYYEAHREENRQRRARYYYAHRDESVRRASDYYHTHSGIIKKRRAEHYMEHREELTKRSTDNYRKYRDKIRDRSAKYYQRNKHIYVLCALRRRARKRSFPDAFTLQDKIRAFEYFEYRCAVCGRPRGLWHTLAMDHWIPLDSPDCPGTVPVNMVPLCHGVDGCNNSKINRDALEWLTQHFGKRKAKQIFERVQVYFDSLEKEMA